MFLDVCNGGSTTALADAFGIHGPDRAFLGWSSVDGDSQHNVDWTNALFQQLAVGYQLIDAINWADLHIGAALTGAGTKIEPAIIGDSLYKLHGVYGKNKV